MKLFKKLSEFNDNKEVSNFLFKNFCNSSERCSTCQLNSTNRPHRDFWEDDDFCCIGMFFNILTMDIKEENTNESTGSS